MNNNNLGPIQKTIVGAQFLFVAFGATVLVPLLVGLDPSVALFTAGLHILVDTSNMTIEEVVAHMGAIVREKCKL